MADVIDPQESVSERAFDYDRTVALSDGVFAIALTLLVFIISFPELSGAARGHLGSELQKRIPEVSSYALSFAVLSFMWLRHHAFFRALKGIDARIATLNLGYLALVAFLPYPTRLLGQYGDEAVSVVVYAGTLVALTLLSVLIRTHGERSGLLAPNAVGPWRRQLITPVVFLLSIPVAVFVGPHDAEWLWAVLLIQSRWR